MMKNQNKLHGENVIPAGYKRTEVGVIPNDWDEINLNSIVSGLEAGVSVNSIDQVDAYSHGKHILKTSCVSNGHFDGYEKKSILPTDVKRAKCSPVKGGIIVSRMNTPALVGEVGYVAESNLDSFLPDRLWQMKFKKDVAHNPKWLATLLSFPPFSKKIKDTATGTSGSMKNISKSAFLSLKLPWPTLKEQNIIGTALSDADALITALEQLIAKKQAIKTATMQQLLTGRTRLPQFAKHPNGCVKGYKSCELGVIPDDWNVYTFDDLIEFCSSGATPYRGNKNFYTGSIRWITSGELNYCIINDTLEKISDEAVKRSNLKIHPAGTFLMAITGLEAAGTRGACGIVGQPAATNQSCMAIYPNEKLLSAYLYHWYVYNGETLAFKYCQGTKQLSYTAGLLRTIPLYIPNMVEEQAAIATILSDMDSELSVLEEKIAKIRDIKQGMMQQLLTGRIRLPLDQQP